MVTSRLAITTGKWVIPMQRHVFVKLMCEFDRSLVESPRVLGRSCTLTALAPGAARLLSLGGTAVFGIMPGSTWSSTSLTATDADTYGLEQGDSRYFVWRCTWCALGGMDRFVRPHTTKSLVDYVQNKSPGQMIGLGTGDSNVYSVFRVCLQGGSLCAPAGGASPSSRGVVTWPMHEWPGRP